MFVVRMKECCGLETSPMPEGERYVAVGEWVKGDERGEDQG